VKLYSLLVHSQNRLWEWELPKHKTLSNHRGPNVRWNPLWNAEGRPWRRRHLIVRLLKVLALGQEAFLAGDPGGADRGKFRLGAHASEEWI
jgi:hypothetical protein